MSFARRRKAPSKTGTPELTVLLADISARQGSSRTARIQSHVQAAPVDDAADPLIDIFAPNGTATPATHRFSGEIANPVMPRQSK